jgi:hypothetical protein
MVMRQEDECCCMILSPHLLEDLRLAKFLQVEETEFGCVLASLVYCNITSSETLKADYCFTVDKSSTIRCNVNV